MKTNSLPRALNQSGGAGGGAHGTSPLLQSRSRFSLHKQGTIDTDVESVLFKRTPFDLMKKNASLLTNIICLAITLSLVLVTVVQFSNNEERWDSFSQRVNKVSADVGQAQELVTQQTLSVQEMEYLLFGNKIDGELSFRNLTDAGKGVINTMVVMKKWYNDHAKMLENLSDQSKQLLKAKNAVLGSGKTIIQVVN
ncbi:Oidioi.mRNA.OKI2018_I69.XSR.g13656.t1.cds [Oikopleura dioica]|uniref:Oidioi.mRNA.OKI2018_I69.XSR.g13656.t1.cds n=1 Tax=Oikopleura dioica TaxID=34765 RepID=A0ABN7SC95_OIKDI|nr:Oidioi.mRNA.OKI2018_I69.XSR.g13656.t1.cds [Oikopleura dioica]